MVNTEGNGNVTYVYDHNLTLRYSNELVFIAENCNFSTIDFYDVSNNFIFNITLNYTDYCRMDIVTSTNNSYTVGNETNSL